LAEGGRGGAGGVPSPTPPALHVQAAFGSVALPLAAVLT
jgi:hypothetical protein